MVIIVWRVWLHIWGVLLSVPRWQLLSFLVVFNHSGKYGSLYIENVVCGCGRDGKLLMLLTLTSLGQRLVEKIVLTISEVENPREPADKYDILAWKRNIDTLKITTTFEMKPGVPYQIRITVTLLGLRHKQDIITGGICESKSKYLKLRRKDTLAPPWPACPTKCPFLWPSFV